MPAGAPGVAPAVVVAAVAAVWAAVPAAEIPGRTLCVCSSKKLVSILLKSYSTSFTKIIKIIHFNK